MREIFEGGAPITATPALTFDENGNVRIYVGTGAYLDDDDGTDSGSAYLYQRTDTGWRPIQKLTADDGAGSGIAAWFLSLSDAQPAVDDPGWTTMARIPFSPATSSVCRIRSFEACRIWRSAVARVATRTSPTSRK